MENKSATYELVKQRIHTLIEGETDEISIMATMAAELHHSFSHFHWVGFYRVVKPGLLKVGPYQGGHGCLTISFDRGVCGKCAREKTTQLVPDVLQVPYHIACSSSTRSEIVVPILDSKGEVRAMLDVDSDQPDAFDSTDQRYLEDLAQTLADIY